MAFAALGVILSVLKVIGIVVLCILALIILLILLILFVPIKWKALGKASDEAKNFGVSGKWLGGVFSFNAKYDSGSFPYVVKLFGHKIFPKGDD